MHYNLPILQKAIIVVIFMSNGLRQGVLFCSISLLEYNSDDQLQRLQDITRLQASPNFFSKLFMMEISLSLHSAHDETLFKSSVNTEVSMKIKDERSVSIGDISIGDLVAVVILDGFVAPLDDCVVKCNFCDTLDL